MHQPCYVLAIGTRPSLGKFLSSEDNQKIVDEIVPLLEETSISFVFTLDGNSKKLGEKIRSVAGAKIYSHKS